MTSVAAVLGAGRTGSRIAALLAARGRTVRASRRSPPQTSAGWAVDLARPETIAPFVAGVRLLVCAASPGRGAGAYEVVYGSGLRAALAAAREAGVERVLVLGSTGVFGHDRGETVDETTPPAPRDDAGRALLAGEDLVRAHGGVVLRLGGLYAKGRGVQSALASAPLDERGRPVLRGRGERTLNLVHEEDAARAAVHVLLDAWVTGVLHVTDGVPVTRRELYEAIAARRGIAPPSFAPSDGDVAEGGLGRIVSSARLRALGFAPRFAGWRAGLAAGELD